MSYKHRDTFIEEADAIAGGVLAWVQAFGVLVLIAVGLMALFRLS